MGPRYYRPGENRGGIRIVPTKKFFMMVAAIAAIVVVIVLIVTLVPASEKDKTISDVTAEEVAETVPAEGETPDSTAEEIPTEDVVQPAETADVTGEQLPADQTTTDPVEDITVPDEETVPADQPAAVTTYKMLQNGSTGDEVKKMQSRLIELGYLESGNDTGKFGPMTEEAVKAFQLKNGIQADGIAGNSTQSLLFSDTAIAA